MEELGPGVIDQIVDHRRLNRLAVSGDPLHSPFRLTLPTLPPGGKPSDVVILTLESGRGGDPLVYELDETMHAQKRYYLGDKRKVEAAIGEVEAQTSMGDETSDKKGKKENVHQKIIFQSNEANSNCFFGSHWHTYLEGSDTTYPVRQ